MLYWMKGISIILVLCLVNVSVTAKPTTKMQVAYYDLPGKDVLTTLVQHVWQEAADVLSIPYTLKKADSKQQAMDWLKQGNVRLVLGPLRVHPKLPDISYVNSYIDDSVGIVVHQYPEAGFIGTISSYFKAVFGATVAFILFVIVIFGAVLWFIESRRGGDAISHKPVRGILSWIWQCLVTFSTVGYGDIVPKTALGRFVTGIWILVSLFLVSAFVASITSELTMLKSHSSGLTSLSKLYNKKVVYVKGEYDLLDIAAQYHMQAVPVADIQTMIKMIDNKKAFAAIGNQYVMQSYLKHHHDSKVLLTPYKLVNGSYAFALRGDDALHRKLSNLLYEFSEMGRIKQIISEVIGVQVAVQHN